MSETKIFSSNGNDKKKSASRIKLLAAIATGALTIEAANILLRQENPDEAPITEAEVVAAADELALSANAINDAANGMQPEDAESEYIDELISIDESETIDLTDAEPEIITDAEPVELADIEVEMVTDAEPVEMADAEVEMVTDAEPVEMADAEVEMVTDAEPVEMADAEVEMVTDAEPIELAEQDNDIADTIIQEIDPNDIDMADAFVVDNVGSTISIDGNEYQAATILDPDGNQAFMVDTDGDNVYDVITTPSGDVIADMNSDIDVSDAELLFAQQHDHDGYIAQNDFDISMNEDNPDIHDDIMLS